MQWDIDFELRRLVGMLTEQLGRGCREQTFAVDEIEHLTTEIQFEGSKIFVEVMKVMSRPYTDEHLRRYLEVHLAGVEYLQERVKVMMAGTGSLCLQLFATFERVVDEVKVCLDNWQKRYFGNGDLSNYKTKEQVMEILSCSESSFYRRKREGNWKTKRIGGIERYLIDSIIG